MTEHLLQQAFEKAGEESGKESVNGRAEYLAEYIQGEIKYSISTKSLTRYYKKESSPNQQVLNSLSNYLGYENYESFVRQYKPEALASKPEISNPYKQRRSTHIIIISLLLISVTGVSGYVGFKSGEEKCMLWEGSSYVETACSGAKNEQKLNTPLLESLQRVHVYDTTSFFKNGQPQFWYYKGENELQYFTAPGLHPVNGKTLRPITKYIIAKYVYSD